MIYTLALTRFLVLALFAAFSPAAAQQQARSTEPPIRALYVTGGGFHDFVALEQIVPPGISARTNITWTVDHTAGKSTEVLIPRHQTTAWADSFDVVVYNMSFSFVVDPQWIERIAQAHRDKGVAAVILHGAVHSYRRSTTEAWKELMGASSMRHDPARVFHLERIADHPIVKGLPKEWNPGVDELYVIEKSWPTFTPLVQGWSIDGGTHHPVVWTNTLGKAKVFVTSFGHPTRVMSDPVYLELITRGLLWTVDKLAADGGPVAGYEPQRAAP